MPFYIMPSISVINLYPQHVLLQTTGTTTESLQCDNSACDSNLGFFCNPANNFLELQFLIPGSDCSGIGSNCTITVDGASQDLGDCANSEGQVCEEGCVVAPTCSTSFDCVETFPTTVEVSCDGFTSGTCTQI